MDEIDLDSLDIDTVKEHSYSDFHAKGVDYICLKRTPELTIKAYFFESGMQDISEVVNPHDHRYSFLTQCLSGKIRNKWYRRLRGFDRIPQEARIYNTYEWRTPLLGGNGFTYHGQATLLETWTRAYNVGWQYFMSSPELHTIQILAPETAILLYQYEDEVPAGLPTLTFTQSSKPPDLTGLYNKFTADQVVKRINLLKELL